MSVHRNAAVAAAVAAALLSARAFALDAPADSLDAADEPQEVIVTGTRQRDVKAIDSPAPVQAVAADELAKTSSTPDLIQTIAIHVSRMSGRDMRSNDVSRSNTPSNPSRFGCMGYSSCIRASR